MFQRPGDSLLGGLWITLSFEAKRGVDERNSNVLYETDDTPRQFSELVCFISSYRKVLYLFELESTCLPPCFFRTPSFSFSVLCPFCLTWDIGVLFYRWNIYVSTRDRLCTVVDPILSGRLRGGVSNLSVSSPSFSRLPGTTDHYRVDRTDVETKVVGPLAVPFRKGVLRTFRLLEPKDYQTTGNFNRCGREVDVPIWPRRKNSSSWKKKFWNN